jgi:hypothetical protein
MSGDRTGPLRAAGTGHDAGIVTVDVRWPMP